MTGFVPGYHQGAPLESFVAQRYYIKGQLHLKMCHWKESLTDGIILSHVQEQHCVIHSVKGSFPRGWVFNSLYVWQNPVLSFLL